MIPRLFLISILLITQQLNASELIKIDHLTRKEIKKLGIEFNPDHFSHPDFSVGYIETKDLTHLPQEFKSRIKILNPTAWAHGAYDLKTFQLTRIDFSEFYEGYHDYTALTAELKSLKEKYPGFVSLETAGKSIEGRELWYVVLTKDRPDKEQDPKFIYHANMHGDEVVGREMMIYLARHLLELYGRDAHITQLLDHAQIFIMPSMNPDGFERHTRENANGRDLNRNFPDRFNSTTDTPNGRQTEVQRMMDLVSKHHFVYGINWHGGEICFNLPWGNISNSNQMNKYWDDWFFNPIGREYTELNRPMYDNDHDNFDHGMTYGYEWYPVNGGINDWFNFYRRAVHSVIELSVVKWPKATELPKFWDDNREAMVTYLWRGLRGVHLDIRNEKNESILSPTIVLEKSPGRELRFDTGFVHRLTGEGLQKITIKVAGYKEKVVNLLPTYFDGSFTNIQIVKAMPKE